LAFRGRNKLPLHRLAAPAGEPPGKRTQAASFPVGNGYHNPLSRVVQSLSSPAFISVFFYFVRYNIKSVGEAAPLRK